MIASVRSPGRGVVRHDGVRADSGHSERERHHHAGPVLARGAVHQRRAIGAGDTPQRPDHLVRTVLQVAEVVAADGIAGNLDRSSRRLTSKASATTSVVEPTSGITGCARPAHWPPRPAVRPLGLQLVGAAQVDDGGHTDIGHQPAHVGSREFLEIVRAQQLGSGRLVAIIGGQVTQVATLTAPSSSIHGMNHHDRLQRAQDPPGRRIGCWRGAAGLRAAGCGGME